MERTFKFYTGLYGYLHLTWLMDYPEQYKRLINIETIKMKYIHMSIDYKHSLYKLRYYMYKKHFPFVLYKGTKKISVSDTLLCINKISNEKII